IEEKDIQLIKGLQKNKKQKHQEKINNYKSNILKLNKFNIFYMKSPNKVLNFVLNDLVVFNSNRYIIFMYLCFLFFAILFFLSLLVLLFYKTKQIELYMLSILLCYFIISIFIHELAHCVTYWLLNKED